MDKPSLRALRELHEKATPGPWFEEKGGLIPSGQPAAGWPSRDLIAATAAGQGNKIYAEPHGGISPPANQRLIVAARNALPALLAIAEAARALKAAHENIKKTNTMSYEEQRVAEMLHGHAILGFDAALALVEE